MFLGPLPSASELLMTSDVNLTAAAAVLRTQRRAAQVYGKAGHAAHSQATRQESNTQQFAARTLIERNVNEKLLISVGLEVQPLIFSVALRLIWSSGLTGGSSVASDVKHCIPASVHFLSHVLAAG